MVYGQKKPCKSNGFPGVLVAEELTTKTNCDFLHDLVKNTPHENVKQKLLELIQAWNFAFRNNPKHGNLKVRPDGHAN